MSKAFLISSCIESLLLRNKLERDTIHTMSSILVGKSLPDKNMTKMSITVTAKDFCPSAISIRFAPHCSCDLIIKTRPPTSTAKLVSASI